MNGKKYSRGLCKEILAVLLLISGLYSHSYAGPYEDGGAAAATVNSKYGSKSGINQNASKPLTSPSTPMTTVNNGASFDGHIMCPSATKFLEMVVIPSASGDLSLMANQKTDFSSSADVYDYAYSVPIQISGVCANGFISCNPGTWVNCNYYTWSAGTDMKLGITPTAVTSLGGCYCINNSCGYTLAAANYDLVLNSLGGGAVGAILKTSPQFAISKATVTPPTATYYGQQASNCTTTSGGSGSGSPQQYYNPGNPTPLTTAAQAESSTQMSQSNSYYSSLSNLQTNTTGGNQVQSCTITRAFNVSTQVIPLSRTGTGSMCVVSDISAGLFKQNSADIYDVLFSSPAISGFPGCPSSSPLTVETVNMTALTLSLPSNAVSGAVFNDVILNGSYSASGCSATSATVTSPNVSLAVSTCASNGYHNGTFSYGLTLSYKYDAEVDTYTDTCTTIANNPNCKLKDETEYDANNNGVSSYLNFNPTGLHVQPSSTTRTTSLGTYIKTYQWWKIGRSYNCSGTQPHDFTNMKNRTATIISSTSGYTGGGGTQTYSDLQCNGSGCTASTGSIDIDPSLSPASPPSCEPACKVKVPSQDTQANASGNKSQFDMSTASFNYYYRSCSSGSCPIDSSKGESVVVNSSGQQCYCTNEFTGVASSLAAIKEAGKELICSTGTKK